MKFSEPLCRIIFGGLFLCAALIVYLLAPSPYAFVAVVLAVNGILCCVGGTMGLLKHGKVSEPSTEAESAVSTEANIEI